MEPNAVFENTINYSLEKNNKENQPGLSKQIISVDNNTITPTMADILTNEQIAQHVAEKKHILLSREQKKSKKSVGIEIPTIIKVENKAENKLPIFHKKQEEAFRELNKEKDFIIAKDVNNGKNYAAVNRNDVLKIIENTPAPDRNYYEMVQLHDLSVSPLNLFMDIDYNGFCDPEIIDNVKNIIIDEVINLLCDAFGIYTHPGNFIVLSSSNDTKTSLHIIMQKHYFQNIQILNKLKQTLFNDLFKRFSDKNTLHLDGGVYTKNRVFRMPFCCKKGSDRFLNFDTPHTFLDALLTKFDGFEIIDTTEFLENQEAKKPKKELSPLPINTNLEKMFLENIDNFVSKTEDYNTWIMFGIRMYKASFSIDTWIKFSSLSSKYNETETIQKWESFSKYEKDDSEMADILRDFLSSKNQVHQAIQKQLKL